MVQSPELSVVIPAYNEAPRLPGTLSVLKPYLNSYRSPWELILVNDGSRDRTMEVIDAEVSLDPSHVRGIDLQPNQGKARAVAAGVAASRGNLVLISDADLSTPIDELAKLRAAIDAGFDVAIGSRGKRGSQVEVSQPVHRMLMGKAFNLIVQAVALPGIWDTQCGFKLWNGTLARDTFAAMQLAGNVAFDVEVLYRARRGGHRIAEVPVRWIDSLPSRISPMRHSMEALGDVLKIRFMK